MEKRHFQNCLSTEKRTFESNVKKYKRLINSQDLVKCKNPKMLLPDSLMSDRIISEPELAEIDVRTSSPFLEYSSNSEGNGDSKDTCEDIKTWAVSNNIIQTAPQDFLPKNDMNNEDVLGMLKNILKYQKDFNTRIEKIEQNQTSTLASQSILRSGQDVIVENLKQLADKLENIQANIVSSPEIMAHSKIAIKKVENIVCRMNAVKHNKISDEIASMLPLQTLAAVQKVEQKLRTLDFAQEMNHYIHLIKGASEDVGSVMREIFTDDVLQKYNWDGRWEKHAIRKLTLVNKTLQDVFQQQDAIEFEKSIKKALERSHHRVQQKQYVKNRNN